jgi:hypothetical protein
VSTTGRTRAYRFSLRRCPANLSAPLCASSQVSVSQKRESRLGSTSNPNPDALANLEGAARMVLVYAIGRMHFEEAEIGARKRQENRDRALTTDPGRFNVPRARLAPAMISTPGHWASRRRQRGALPAWSLRIVIRHGVPLARSRVLLTSAPRVSLVAQTSCCQRFLAG